jgi:hypothetical protein
MERNTNPAGASPPPVAKGEAMSSAPRHRRLLLAALAVTGIAVAFVAMRAPGSKETVPPPAAVTPASQPLPSLPSLPLIEATQLQALAERTDLTLPQKIEALLAAAPAFSLDDRLATLQVAMELIPDEDHPKYRLRLLRSAGTPELRDLIAHDALSRGEEIGLPVLLDILRLADGDDERRDIRDLLEAYLAHDYGANADAWEQPVKSWLAEHAGEP